MLKSGQDLTSPVQLGQLKTAQSGKGLLRIHPWCLDDLPRLWDRLEHRGMSQNRFVSIKFLEETSM